jgi:hypothetical protein
MNEHQRHTEFLREIIRYDDTEERHKLEGRIVEVQRDERCVKRAARLMALFVALSAAGVGYGAVLQDNFPYGKFGFLVRFICELGLAAVICLAVFAVLLAVYRVRLNRLRDEFRKVVNRILESQLGKAQVAKSRGARLEAGDSIDGSGSQGKLAAGGGIE